ncbi:hypothetical protein M0805_007076 [Coniferiporia weirii]|nr:hypothetical protein M0805_007076 [Coniferiporia weirii]
MRMSPTPEWTFRRTLLIRSTTSLGPGPALNGHPEHKAVVVTLRCLIVYSGYDSKVFVSLSQTLWQTSTDDRLTSPFPLNTSVEKLSGKRKHSWPLSITLPLDLSFSTKEAKDLKLSTTGRLPPNFEGEAWSAFINYQVTLNIKRSSLFRSDSEVTTLVGYVPATRPNPPSYLRGSAYQKKTLILDPDIDTEGWEVSSEVQVKGKLFKVVHVTISPSLALAIPIIFYMNDMHIRTILGELHIPRELVPAFKFGQVDCRYVVDMYPPKAAGFEPVSGTRLSRSEITGASMVPSAPNCGLICRLAIYDKRMAQIKDFGAQSRN